MTIALSTQDKTTIRIAAYGAVTLMSSAGIAGSAHKIGTDGSLALAAATGVVGHVIAEAKAKELKFPGKSTAAIADQVLPALTESVKVLSAQDADEAENFRATILVAVEAATRAHKGAPSPTMAAMSRKITEALDAA
ncbi:hypothetical protein [Glycomyces rhizosphaerae]|uniref:Uncharacterized protein n=1 Tax=Glycomyces rhizosphaerae TaxID=2054422 RepID=A0ABV7PZ06_9ACTN